MVLEDEFPNQKSSSNPLEKWSQQATTSAFGFMESLRGQSSSFAKNLKSFGKSLVKDQKSTNTGPSTPPEHRDDDIRLTWLTNRLVLADTLHNSKDGLLKAEQAVVREMMDCQPYVVVNVHSEPLRLDGYAKSVHVPMGNGSKGGIPKYPTIQALIPILNEYCLLTNDAAIVIFGSDENVQLTAAFCLIASRSLSRIFDFLRDSLRNRFERIPTTYKLFLEQTKDICKAHTRKRIPSIGISINSIFLEPGNMLIDGELYVAIQQGVNQLKVLEFSANSVRNSMGQLVFGMDSADVVDDVIVFVGNKTDVKHPLLVARFNTQLLEADDTSVVLTSSEMDVSRAMSQPIQDLRMIVNFATRRIPTLNSFQFDRYKLLCVRNERELDGYQKSYGDVDSEDESPILRSGREKSKKSESGSNFFDSLQFSDHREKGPSLLNEQEEPATTGDLLAGFSISNEKASSNETPILSAPTPQNSNYDTSPLNFSANSSSSPAIDDLLGLGTENLTTTTGNNLNSSLGSQSNSAANLVDFDFGTPIKPSNSAVNSGTRSSPPAAPQFATTTNSWSNSDLLGGFSTLQPQKSASAPMATPPNTRVSSAANSKPVSQVNSQADFEAFLSNYPEKQQHHQAEKIQTKTRNPTQNSYKPAFGEATTAKVSSDAFSDLLNQGGFKPTTRESQKQTIGTMLKSEQSRNLTPEDIKIRDWTEGKERNIRALLCSLQNVLWEGTGNWNQPSITDLLTADQIKKHYRKALLVVHPDKLSADSPHLTIARMIFTELNDAYTKYTNDPTLL